jgi:hypothetical protein
MAAEFNLLNLPCRRRSVRNHPVPEMAFIEQDHVIEIGKFALLVFAVKLATGKNIPDNCT